MGAAIVLARQRKLLRGFLDCAAVFNLGLEVLNILSVHSAPS
jgi:hypothetical protein